MLFDKTREKTHLPATKLGPKPARRTKAKANAKVVSPLAARGIEIKRNLANRRQASSVPQREIDIDKELESWKKKRRKSSENDTQRKTPACFSKC